MDSGNSGFPRQKQNNNGISLRKQVEGCCTIYWRSVAIELNDPKTARRETWHREVKMITREMLHNEIDSLPDSVLDEAYRLVKRLSPRQATDSGQTLMSRLREVTIQGPTDFAADLDLYLSGEKRIESDLH